MILTDAKKSQAQIVIGLEDVAGVSVSSLQDGLFSLHLSEVFEPPRWGLCGVGILGLRWAGYARTKFLTIGSINLY